MSGGRFNYDQYKIGYIADDIEHEIEMSGKPLTKEELKAGSWLGDDWYDRHPEDLNHYKYPDEVIERFKLAVKYLRVAEVYAHRIDWLLSGDEGEESFLERLDKDLKKMRISANLTDTMIK